MRKIIFILIPVGMLFSGFKKIVPDPVEKPHPILSVSSSLEQRLQERVKIIKQFISTNPKYNKELAFFIDMRVMSGKNRFIVYDLKNDKIVDQGLVAHGLGSETGQMEDLKFSNTNSSFCTSLGKYSIGQDYFGKYGKAYKLFGLDYTNSNAFARSIVLHKYDKVPYEEQDYAIVHSLGCPMVNEIYFNRIEKLIDNSKRNIILDIYY
nr:murein L,D-transpeptidase catalytic domain family protein [uncultured Flavobacterium sp.]